MSRDVDNFRALLICALATLAFAFFVSWKLPLPREVQELYGLESFGAVTSGIIEWYWYWIELALYCASLISMFFFWRYARILMLITLFSTPLRTGLGGIWVSSPVEDAFWSLHWVFVILAVGMALFHPPIRAKFGRHHLADPTNQASPPNKSLERTREG